MLAASEMPPADHLAPCAVQCRRDADLTDKQATFVAEYLIDLNGAQAAIRAGYSKRTARDIAAENLSKPHIAAAIQTAMDERARRTEITADRVLKELAKIGFSDIGGIFTPGGNLLPPGDMEPDMRAAIQSIEVVTRRVPGDEKRTEDVHKIKLADKLGGLIQIGRHLGMFTDKSETTAKGEMTVIFSGDEANL